MKDLLKGVGCLLMIPFILLSLPWTAIHILGLLQPAPPRPEIRHGEFPFRLVYSVNGEEKVIEDAVVARFSGIVRDGSGSWRRWDGRLASGNEHVVLLKIDENRFIFYLPGSPNYYMGDLPTYATWNPDFPNAWLFDESQLVRRWPVNADELLSEYGIVLISWEPSPPIVNSFK